MSCRRRRRQRSMTCWPGLAPANSAASCEPSSWTSTSPLTERRLGVDRRVLGVSPKPNAQADRRPLCRFGVQMRELRLNLLALRLQCVDPQIERRARRERRSLGGAIVAEHLGQMRIEPIRIIARDRRRRSREGVTAQVLFLCFAQWRRSEARAVAQLLNRRDVEPALAPQHAEQRRARRPFSHRPAGRRLAAQRVIDKASDRGAVGRAGKPMRQAPVLEHIRRRPPPRFRPRRKPRWQPTDELRASCVRPWRGRDHVFAALMSWRAA